MNLFLRGMGLALLALVQTSALGEVVPTPLRGAAFSSPQLQVTMPAKWLSKGIVHTEDAREMDLVINMDQQFYFFLEPLIADYARQKGWKVKLIEGTCGTAEAMLRRKSLDIGGFCCPPAATDRLPGVEFHTLGIQGVAILAHASNPVENITLSQLRLMYQNKINSWKEVGGPDIAVRPIVRAHCELRPGHWRLVLDNKDMFGPRIIDVGSMDDLFMELVRNPGSVGYEELPTLRRLDKSGQIKSIRLNGVAVDDIQAMAEGRYPVYQLINLSLWRDDHTANSKARELVAYLKDKMEQVEASRHFVPTRMLRQHGWKFTGEEVTGEPDGMAE